MRYAHKHDYHSQSLICIMDSTNSTWKTYTFLVHLVFHNINEIFALCIAYKYGKLCRSKGIFVTVIKYMSLGISTVSPLGLVPLWICKSAYKYFCSVPKESPDFTAKSLWVVHSPMKVKRFRCLYHQRTFVPVDALVSRYGGI